MLFMDRSKFYTQPSNKGEHYESKMRKELGLPDQARPAALEPGVQGKIRKAAALVAGALFAGVCVGALFTSGNSRRDPVGHFSNNTVTEVPNTELVTTITSTVTAAVLSTLASMTLQPAPITNTQAPMTLPPTPTLASFAESLESVQIAIGSCSPATIVGLIQELGNLRIQALTADEQGEFDALLLQIVETDRCKAPIKEVGPQPVIDMAFSAETRRLLAQKLT